MKKVALFIAIIYLWQLNSFASEKRFITVAADGSGDFKTITEAVHSLPAFNYQRTTIFIKNGIYNEKIRIEKDYITLKGEDKEKTVISFSQLRSDWDAKKDSIGPAVINIYADDFIMENITVENTQPEIGPHAFAVLGFGTRTIILNCILKSRGADTVSLWNNKNGMYYHSNCYFEGAVDFVCPRGWCFIKDSRFYEIKKTAAIWHAGGDDIKQKFVIVNSSFDGIEGWELGRHHYEAQFFLINCTFSFSMSEKPIYRVTYPKEPERDKPFNWGQRYYFYNCIKQGESFGWIADNLSTAEGSPKAEDIIPSWVFENKWDPETKTGAKIVNYTINNNSLILFFNEKLTISGIPVIRSDNGTEFTYHSGGGSDTIRLTAERNITKQDISGLRIIKGKITGVIAAVSEREADLKIN